MEIGDCSNVELNTMNCPCTNIDCDNRGICCQCVQSHRAKNGYPACLRYT